MSDLTVLNFSSDDIPDVNRADDFFNTFVDTVNLCRSRYVQYLLDGDYDNSNLLALDRNLSVLWSVLGATYRGDI